MEHQFNYKAQVLKIIDGDTIRLKIDLGFKVHWTSNCRLAYINTPELGNGGEVAKQYVIDKLPINSDVYIISQSLDKYGRPIVIVNYDGGCLNDELINNGLAKKY